MKRRRGGSIILETALWLPVMVMLVVFVIQIGKITLTYYSLKNSVYSAAQYLASQQGVNFCDLTGDPTIQSALQIGTTGTADGSGPPLINNLTADMLSVNIQCVDPVNPAVPGTCNTPCGSAFGPGPRPDYIVVNIPGGYAITPRMLFLTLDPVVLSPSVMVPFRGASL